MKKILLMLFFTVVASFSWATLNVYEFSDTEKEQRFKVLINELRCPKCQNNNLADSNAPLATDIKKYVYQSVNKGKTDKEITDFLISRYGQFVTYRPQNIWVWILPTAIGVLALCFVIWVIGRKRKTAPNTDKDIPTMQTIIEQHQQQTTGEK
ncbi:MAG: cytochrome c-type biogenesis protein CcmH [Gammaproteobacteria bacterium]|nr:cytochrome c-type biogenesis protein CcmH [Gammaproteobacteria bacterium]